MSFVKGAVGRSGLYVPRRGERVIPATSRSVPVDALLDEAIKVARDPRLIQEVPAGRRAEVESVVKAVQAGAATPGPLTAQSLQNQRPVNAQVLAQRAHQALAPSSSITPPDIQLALQRQGLDWVEPFSPGKPLVPYYGYGRRPRNYDYQVGRNVTTETRPNRIPFATLKHLFESYDIAMICTRHAINDLRSMRIRFEPMDGYRGKDLAKALARAREFWARPDGVLSFTGWLAKHAMDVWRYDAGTLFKQRDRAGNLISLKVVDGTTIAPMLDYFGDRPSGEAPAYQQFIQGIPWDWLTADNLVYEPMWPLPESPYGVAPLETVLINANTDVRLQMFFLDFFCYDDQTEVLTRGGWRRFADLDGSEEYATRSPEGKFEWQRTTDGLVHRFPYEGDLVRFHSNCVDQLVTPNHRMLVRRIPHGDQRNPSHDWHIRRADHFLQHPSAEFQLPLTSEWEGTDPGPEVVLTAPPAKRGRPVDVRMASWAWAELLGLFIAEGWRRKDRYEVLVSQWPNGDLDEVRRILKDTGLNWTYSPSNGTFSCSSKALWTALAATGSGAPNKRVPSAAMDWTAPLLRHLLHGLMIGDGHVTPSGQKVYTTTSRTLADQVQELWQKVGTYARVDTYEPDPRSHAKRVQYRVTTNPKAVFRVPPPTPERYVGKVSCVSVPNGIIFVRRNGQAIWCGNTKGQVPEAFAIAPEDQSDPDSLAELQETYNDWTYGDQAERWGLRWLPAGTSIEPYKPQEFDPELAEYVMRRTTAAFMMVPNDMGFTADVNRASGETQVDVQFRVSTSPNVAYYQNIFDTITQQDLGLPVQLRFDTGREKEDRLMEAKAHYIYWQMGAERSSEVRSKILGYEVSPEDETPLTIDNMRLGIIPMEYVLSISGDYDPLTGMPKPGSVQQREFVVPGMMAPDPLVDQGVPHAVANEPEAPSPKAQARKGRQGEDAQPFGPETDEIDDGPEGQGTHGAHPIEAPGYGVADLEENARALGPTAASGVPGYAERDDLRKWRANARKAVVRGKRPRRFDDSAISPATQEWVWAHLERARTRAEVDEAFAKAERPTVTWGDFHRHTDAVVGHYMPQVAEAMADVLSPETIRKVLDAVGGVAKAAQPASPPNVPPAQAAAVTAGTAGLGVAATPLAAGAAAAGAGAAAVGAGAAAAAGTASAATKLAVVLAILAHAPRALHKLRSVLTGLYGDAYMQGAHEAAHAAAGAMPPWTAAVPVPDGYWDRWAPGVGHDASEVAGGGLAAVLRERDMWIKEMTDTQVNRIGDAVKAALEHGPVDMKALAAEIDRIVHDEARAWLIAETEYCRGMARALMDTYRLNRVPMIAWLAEPTACHLCKENEAVSPQPTADPRWPNGTIPVHPHERCALAPAYGTPRREPQ